MRMEDKALQAAIVRMDSVEDTVDVFRHIMMLCGFHESSIVFNPQTREINPLSTIHDESRRKVWLDIRRFIPHDILARIESPEPMQKGDKECQTQEPQSLLPQEQEMTHRAHQRQLPPRP